MTCTVNVIMINMTKVYGSPSGPISSITQPSSQSDDVTHGQPLVASVITCNPSFSLYFTGPSKSGVYYQSLLSRF